MLHITFQPMGREISICPGASILDAARAAGLLGTELQAPCAGQGVCGRCQVRIISGSLQGHDSIDPQNLYLACASFPSSHLTVELLPAPQWRQIVMSASLPEVDFQPVLQAVPWQLNPPTRSDNLNDGDRLLLALKPQGISDAVLDARVLSQLPVLLRQNNWQGVAWWLRPENKIAHLSATPNKCLLAVDVGTTSLWLQLIDASSGRLLAESSALNPQEGEDIINRMLAAERPGGKTAQQQAVLHAINQLCARMLGDIGLTAEHIGLVACAGNTVMTQLLLGIDCRPLRLEPYVPAVGQYPMLDAGAQGLNCQAPLFIMPCVGAYVGGDIVAGVLATGLDQNEGLSLFIDLGTNGEVVLGNCQWMISAAASAGPAFEGGGISCGMVYGPGAIYDFNLHGKEPQLAVVGNEPPRGICGSGLVALAAALLQHGIISQDGRLVNGQPGVRAGQDGLEYVLSDEHGLTINQADLQNLLRAKAAVYAACACLLASADITIEQVDNIILAGSFGNSLNLEHAITIGLLPELPGSRFSYAGNSSLAGARAVLINQHMRQRARQISQSITYVELANQPDYMDHYTAALFFPHTQGQTLFPATWQKIKAKGP